MSSVSVTAQKPKTSGNSNADYSAFAEWVAAETTWQIAETDEHPIEGTAAEREQLKHLWAAVVADWINEERDEALAALYGEGTATPLERYQALSMGEAPKCGHSWQAPNPDDDRAIQGELRDLADDVFNAIYLDVVETGICGDRQPYDDFCALLTRMRSAAEAE